MNLVLVMPGMVYINIKFLEKDKRMSHSRSNVGS